ncbi:UDP-glucose 4-epimerase GalE [Rhizobium sp. L1K21]|uniref:UDP-glucose 4-epimerase GalE n=1 Tax=Rhizobium sp. L1K21 TaxID=2954933 RepID=UPI0020926E4F|nr:UDP-glucose 4-epimerase GalE [Rhizobium sp. L1K21]MCO6187294.1 UDP-glucose 4-epimerase GalE [Rhizobium sp. L1K21]
MAVLVTGGAGYIGSHTAWALLDAGDEVVIVDRLSTGHLWSVPPEARFYEGDIGDSELIGRILGENSVDSIIHFAGSIVVPESVSDPLSYYENNTVKSRSLMASAINAGVPNFVFSSTAAVYGTPVSIEPVDETAPLNPESPYGSSKYMTEVMLRDSAAAYEGFNYTALRYFNVAGADPQGRTGQSSRNATHLIKVAVQVATGKREGMSVFGTDYPTPDGTCIRDYIHVTDLANAHVLAVQRMRNGGGSLVANCGYGRGFSVLEVLETVEKVAGKNLNVTYAPRRAGDAVSIVANPARARKELSWVPEHDDLEEIVATALTWEERLSKHNQA